MGPGARIGPLVAIKAKTFVMGPDARIGALCRFKVREVTIGRDGRFDPMVLVNCDFGPRSKLEVGRAARVFSFSILEPSEGIYIGDQTGLGGQCLVFCHGSWPNYFEGAPYSRGPVRLEDRVWIPWRVMILPNAVIGSGAVIGAHSMVRGRVPPGALYSGVPARLVLEEVWTAIDDPAEKERRLQEAIESFHAFHEGELRPSIRIVPLSELGQAPDFAHETVAYAFQAPEAESVQAALAHPRTVVMDLAGLNVLGSPGRCTRLLSDHLATFGVRLSTIRPGEPWK
jgi:acetyltransferase-like isoleucine patch superfamily enzyme